MPVTSPLADLVGPIAGDPAGSGILLDLDGTVAPIVARPSDVAIAPAIRALLPALRDRFALVAFISGRALPELARIVALDGLALSGNHGAEIRLADGERRDPPAPDDAGLRAFLTRWDGPALADAGVWLEDKGATATFHYRTAPDPTVAREILLGSVAPAARADGLIAAPGRMSLEVRPAGALTKGTATALILESAGAGLRRALSLGDDRTDLDVWAAIRRRRAAGLLDTALGIGVGSSESPPELLREADGVVDGVAGAAALLQLLVAHPGT